MTHTDKHKSLKNSSAIFVKTYWISFSACVTLENEDVTQGETS